MSRNELINHTVIKIRKLPDDKLQEVDDFVDYLLSKYEDRLLTKGIQKLASESKAFDFLNDEEELYTENDIIETYK